MKPTFRADPNRPGLTVTDPIENAQYPLETPAPVSIEPAATEGFHAPVDAAAAVSTDRLVLPYVVTTYVRDRTGDVVCDVSHDTHETLPEGEYVLELMAPVRLYVRVRAPVTVASTDDRLSFSFGGAAAAGDPTVRLGARSLHERPAATVATTAAPGDLARAISTFGSALKTEGPERSYPTFRGHPPRIELAEAVSVPDGLEPPETGVEIVVPPERTAVYAASSLAYYLGARVVTGPSPRVETDGVVHELGGSGRAFERSVEDVLERAFFFDCVIRTDGIYRMDLDERRRVEERVDLDLAGLYDASLADRLEAALSVPRGAVADLFPTWKLAVHATSDPENATALPFLANELATIRAAPAEPAGGAAPGASPIGVDAFVRSSVGSGSRPSADSYVSVPAVDADERAWLGPGIPIGANDLGEAGFENGLRTATPGDAVDIRVVCNDDRMADELADGLYGGRADLRFDVDVERNLTVAALGDRIAADADFLHYVGHVEDGAFVCADGRLPVEDLTDVGVETFLVNGCRSYEIGTRLVEAGSAGGIATLSDVGNEDAVAVGRLIARLLNAGFSLRGAVELARSRRLVGNQYLVVGDGGTVVTQSGGGVPTACRVESTDGGYRLSVRSYHVGPGMGAAFIPYVDGVERHFLAGREAGPFDVSGDELSRFLGLEEIPVEFDGEACWSTDDRFRDLQ